MGRRGGVAAILMAAVLSACIDRPAQDIQDTVNLSLRQSAAQAEASRKWLEATATYRSLYTRLPDDPAIAAGLMRSLRNIGQSEDAARIGTEAAERMPGNPLILTEHAKARLASGDLPQA